jgi:CBS domain-containing protein
MFDEPIRNVMRRRKLLTAPPETLVSKAARMMAKRNVGAVVVVAEGQLVGIFTERDIAFRVVACGLEARTTRLADVMTPAPHAVGPDQRFGHALLKMHEGGFRHLPVIEGGKVIGIVSARSAMDPDLEEFASEASRRERYRQNL